MKWINFFWLWGIRWPFQNIKTLTMRNTEFLHDKNQLTLPLVWETEKNKKMCLKRHNSSFASHSVVKRLTKSLQYFKSASTISLSPHTHTHTSFIVNETIYSPLTDWVKPVSVFSATFKTTKCTFTPKPLNTREKPQH